jgi:hypothetical protein
MELLRLRDLGRDRGRGGSCHVTMKVLLILISIAFSLNAPLFAESILHVGTLFGITPVGRSLRFKESVFLREDKPSFFFATPVYYTFNKNMILCDIGAEFGKLRFYKEDHILGEKVANSIFGHVGYGRSLDSRRLFVPYAGLGYHMYDLPEVIEVNGVKEVGDKYYYKDSPYLVLGLKSQINDRFSFNYNFNSFGRIRHRLLMDISLFSSVHRKHKSLNKKDPGDLFLDMISGVGFDKGSYNVYIAIKVEITVKDTSS